MDLLDLLGLLVVSAPAVVGAILGLGVMINGLITGYSADASKPGGEAWKIMWMLNSFWVGFFLIFLGVLVSGVILFALTFLFGFELPGL